MTRTLLLLPLAALVAAGQTLTCTANALSPPILRVEGISERVADILLDCDGTFPAGSRADLAIFVNGTIVTNPLLNANLTNALLFLDEPPTASQTLGANVLQGQQQGSNSIQWRNLPIDGHHTFRLTNVRVSGAMAGIGSTVEALLNISRPGDTAPLFAAPLLKVATFSQGMQMTLSGVTAFSQCTAGTRKVQVRFTEQSVAAFKSAAEETGFFNPRLGLPAASSGTRVQLVLDSMTYGTLRIAATPSSGSSGSLTAKYIGEGTILDDGTVEPPVIDGRAIALWEVTSSDLNTYEILAFDVILTTTSSGAEAGSPPVGRYCARGFFAPAAGPAVAILYPPVSRFDDYKAAVGVIGIDASQVAMPFTSNALGFETGIAFRGSSDDYFESGGKCSLAPYGSNMPGIYGSPQIYTESVACAPAGASLKLLASPAISYYLDPAAAPQWKEGFTAAYIGQGGVSEFTMLDASGASVPFRTDDQNTGATALGGWLRAEIWNDTSPAMVRYRIDPSGLAPGSYQRYITLRAGAGEAQTLPVNIFVPGPAPSFERAGVTHAGSFKPGYVSPGQATVIFGKDFGTDSGATRVFFDGIEAVKIYTYSGQVSVFAPFALAGKTETKIQVEYQGSRSLEVAVPVLQQNPSLLTLRSDGAGQVTALNEDGSLNNANSGAIAGSVVSLFGTGAGQSIPASVDGQLGQANAQFLTPMAVKIGGQDAQVLHQGPATFTNAGVFQLNVRIPVGTPAGPALIQITQGSQISQIGNTVWVK